MRLRIAGAALFGVLGACSSPTAGTRLAPPPTAQASAPAPVVYAAMGASETVGIGADQPQRQAWPYVFFANALPANAVFYNFGIPGEKTQAAINDELPEALSVHPTIVTVWLNVNDLVAGVSPADYEGQLGRLVRGARQNGAARVLVANTPYLDRLPLYLACRAGTGDCSQIGIVPAPADLNALTDAYNAAVARVVAREGATLVDLHAAGETADLHPTWVSSDGFHPSAAGHAAVAAAFRAALGS